MNTNLIESYIQKIIDLTDSNCLVWEQNKEHCCKIYECEWCNHVLKFSQFVDSICHLTINDVEYFKKDDDKYYQQIVKISIRDYTIHIHIF